MVVDTTRHHGACQQNATWYFSSRVLTKNALSEQAWNASRHWIIANCTSWSLMTVPMMPPPKSSASTQTRESNCASVLRPMRGRVKVRRSMLHSTGYARGHWVNTLTRIPPSFASSTPMVGWKPTSWILCCRGSITQISVEYRSEYALITGVPTYWPACKTSNLCSIQKCFNAAAAISALYVWLVTDNLCVTPHWTVWGQNHGHKVWPKTLIWASAYFWPAGIPNFVRPPPSTNKAWSI